MICKLRPWAEQGELERTWAWANQINPDHVLPDMFIDLDERTIHCLEVVRPAEVEAVEFPPSIFGVSFHRFGLLAAQEHDQLVVSRVVPLIVDPPEQILAPPNQAQPEGTHG
jgi:hypothetical protein